MISINDFDQSDFAWGFNTQIYRALANALGIEYDRWEYCGSTFFVDGYKFTSYQEIGITIEMYCDRVYDYGLINIIDLLNLFVLEYKLKCVLEKD